LILDLVLVWGEKKTPQAFRVRGLSDEFSLSAQTPAPIAVDYYQKGGAVGIHLKFVAHGERA
jgi:hypothetical protein